jgi:RNA polymerase sigma factor for flagellar operon FliA
MFGNSATMSSHYFYAVTPAANKVDIRARQGADLGMDESQSIVLAPGATQLDERPPARDLWSPERTAILDAKWRLFWEDRSRRDVRTELASAYEFVIPCVIRSLGRRLKSYWEKDELHALAYIGLLQSIDSFAVGSSAGQFFNYATLRVRGVIFDELRALDFLPRAVREDVNRVQEATERLLLEHRTEPTRSAISEAAGLTPRQGERVITAMRSLHFLQLDLHVMSQGAELPLGETVAAVTIGPEESVIESIDRDAVVEALLKLPPRERAALSFRYFGQLTQLQIAGMLGVSHSRICQIEKSALGHLRGKLAANELCLTSVAG